MARFKYQDKTKRVWPYKYKIDMAWCEYRYMPTPYRDLQKYHDDKFRAIMTEYYADVRRLESDN